MRKDLKFLFALIFIIGLAIFVSQVTCENQAHGYGIVNNSGTTPADSLPIPFYALDSAGNVVAMASGDSVFLYTFYPSGALASEDSAAYNGTKITAKTRHGFSVYTWKDAVSDIDGTAVQGVYSYMLVVKDLTSAALQTPHTGTFQLLTETDFNTTMEYVKDCLDTLQNQDGWVAQEAGEIADILDTLQNQDDWVAKEATVAEVPDIADTLENHDNWIAKEATVQIIDDSLDSQDGWVAKEATVAEVPDIADTLENQDNWIAKEATVQIIDDSLDAWDDNIAEINDILDTLQNYDDWIAKEATVAEVPDIADTLENHDDWVAQEAGEIGDILDTLQNQDDWVAHQTTVDSNYAIADSLLDTLLILQDTLEAYIDTAYTHIDSFFATTFGAAAVDSVNAYIDSAYAFLDSFFATTFLTASDNIGINWADVSNPATTIDFTNTTIQQVDYAYVDGFNVGAQAEIEAECEDGLADYGASTFDPATDNVAVVDSVTKVYILDSLDQTITATCAGAGVRSIIFKTLDASDSSAVADVRIEAQTGGSYYADCHTTVSGVCTLSLDDATYTVHINDPPNDFTSPITFDVTADSTDTLWGTIFAGSAPPSADKCNLYTSAYDLSGDSLHSCILSVWISDKYQPVKVDGNPIGTYTLQAISDVHGDVDIDIWESGEMTAGDASLTVKVNLEFRRSNGDLMARKLNYEVPDSVSHKIVW